MLQGGTMRQDTLEDRTCDGSYGNDEALSEGGGKVIKLQEEEPEEKHIEERESGSGRRVNEYVGMGVVGRGGLGTVLLAAHCTSKQVVAIKAILKNKGSNLSGVHTETQVLGMLGHHPFLPRLHSHFESESYAFLVMDYCSGGDLHTLRQRQADRRLSQAAIRFYAAELVLALEHLHGLGIVYRDLKPENVLISDAGHVVLTDFDLSLRLSSIHDEADQDTHSCTSATSKHLKTIVPADDKHAPTRIGTKPVVQRRPNCLVSCFATGSVVAPDAEDEVAVSATVELQRSNSKLCARENMVAPASDHLPSKAKGVTELGREENIVAAAMEKRSWKLYTAMARRQHKEEKVSAGGDQQLPWKGSAREEARPAAGRRCCRYFVGTEEYVAPEVIRGEGYSYAVDWWALGVLLYELMSGRTPFKGRDRKSTFNNIVKQEVAMPGPSSCDPLRDLLKQLLVKDPLQRLARAERVKAHAFFQGVRWELLQHIARPPFVPQSSGSFIEGCPIVDVESLLQRVVDKAPPTTTISSPSPSPSSTSCSTTRSISSKSLVS